MLLFLSKGKRCDNRLKYMALTDTVHNRQTTHRLVRHNSNRHDALGSDQIRTLILWSRFTAIGSDQIRTLILWSRFTAIGSDEIRTLIQDSPLSYTFRDKLTIKYLYYVGGLSDLLDSR
jgi:hypothetical protein